MLAGPRGCKRRCAAAAGLGLGQERAPPAQNPAPMAFRHLSMLPALAAAAVLVAGCGESESHTTASTTPSSSGAETTTSNEQQTSTTPTTTTTQSQTQTSTTTTGGQAPQGSSSGGEPAFVEAGKGVEGLAGAEAALRAHGYTPVETATYKPQQTLRVLVGSSSSGEHAFFFVGNRYIGTDSKTASTQIAVTSEREGAVTVRYTLYSQGKPAGSSSVTFQLENGSLQAQQAIPPAAQRTAG